MRILVRNRILWAFAFATILLSLLGVYEFPARTSLWKADFSTRTYWTIDFSSSRRVISSWDRNPTDFDWINYFPKLEELNLVANRNNCNNFPTLEPFTRIKNLRILKLTGVSLRTVDKIPSFPHLEEMVFTESYCWLDGYPTSEQLLKLKKRLPKLRKLGIDNDGFEYLVWNSDSEQFYFKEDK